VVVVDELFQRERKRNKVAVALKFKLDRLSLADGSYSNEYHTSSVEDVLYANGIIYSTIMDKLNLIGNLNHVIWVGTWERLGSWLHSNR